VATVAIAAVFLDEKPHIFHIVGGALALAGVMLAQMRTPRLGLRTGKAGG